MVSEGVRTCTDILGLEAIEVGGLFSSGDEYNMTLLAEKAVQAGGLAFLFVDGNMIKPGGPEDVEEPLYYQLFQHSPRSPDISVYAKVHSQDDDWPPDHWVVYLDGLNFGRPPDPGDSVGVRVWSWGGEYLVSGTAETFGEYLYGVVAGFPRN